MSSAGPVCESGCSLVRGQLQLVGYLIDELHRSDGLSCFTESNQRVFARCINQLRDSVRVVCDAPNDLGREEWFTRVPGNLDSSASVFGLLKRKSWLLYSQPAARAAPLPTAPSAAFLRNRRRLVGCRGCSSWWRDSGESGCCFCMEYLVLFAF